MKSRTASRMVPTWMVWARSLSPSRSASRCRKDFVARISPLPEDSRWMPTAGSSRTAWFVPPSIRPRSSTRGNSSFGRPESGSSEPFLLVIIKLRRPWGTALQAKSGAPIEFRHKRKGSGAQRLNDLGPMAKAPMWPPEKGARASWPRHRLYERLKASEVKPKHGKQARSELFILKAEVPIEIWPCWAFACCFWSQGDGCGDV